MTRKIAFLFLILLSALTLSSCRRNPDKVKIASEKEIRNYAEQHYGAASSYEVTRGKNSRTVTFTDAEYGFTYTVTSRPSAIGIDSGTLGYIETKVSDFSTKYYETLYARAEEKFRPECSINYGTVKIGEYNCHVYHVNTADAENVTGKIGRYLKKLDTRNFFSESDSCVKAYQGEKESYIGSWHVSDGRYYYYADENIKGKTLTAESMVNSTSATKKNITFLYWEQMDVSEVPGIRNWELVHHTIDDGTLVTLYWFDIDGEKHFIADMKVWNLGDVYYSDLLKDKRRKKENYDNR